MYETSRILVREKELTSCICDVLVGHMSGSPTQGVVSSVEVCEHREVSAQLYFREKKACMSLVCIVPHSRIELPLT